MKRAIRLGKTGAVFLAMAAISACESFPMPEPVPPPSRESDTYVRVESCVVDLSRTRGLRSIQAFRDPDSSGLYIAEGRRYRPIARQYAANQQSGYAAAEEWFQPGEAIRQYGRRYVIQGPLRVVPSGSLTLGAPHNGVPSF